VLLIAVSRRLIQESMQIAPYFARCAGFSKCSTRWIRWRQLCDAALERQIPIVQTLKWRNISPESALPARQCRGCTGLLETAGNPQGQTLKSVDANPIRLGFAEAHRLRCNSDDANAVVNLSILSEIEWLGRSDIAIDRKCLWPGIIAYNKNHELPMNL
jgi:hypothetical protein